MAPGTLHLGTCPTKDTCQTHPGLAQSSLWPSKPELVMFVSSRPTEALTHPGNLGADGPF